MIGVAAWTTIRYPHAQGTGIRGIAGELSTPRSAVGLALNQDELPRHVRTKRPEEELGRYVKEIGRMQLEQDFVWEQLDGT